MARHRALHAVKLFGGHDHDRIATMQGHALRPTGLGVAYNLAQLRLGILQAPAILGRRAPTWAFGFGCFQSLIFLVVLTRIMEQRPLYDKPELIY